MERVSGMRLGLLALGIGVSLVAGPVRAQDDGWTIDRFQSDITVQPDGVLDVVETIEVDFNGLQKHGIYREIPVRYAYDDEQERVLDLTLEDVTDGSGRDWRTKTEQVGANVQLRIGDPDRTVSGRQTYRIHYRVAGALNSFADHDELYWNATGAEWAVPIRQATARVTGPAGSITRATCFEGPEGSTDPCSATSGPDQATFGTTASLDPSEQLTAVVALRKGAVPEPRPLLRRRSRDVTDFFDLNPGSLLGGLAVLVGGIGVVLATWWRHGRDRRFTTTYYLTQNPEERTRPLLGHELITVEYQPPEGLRPAEIGLLLDERADTKDVTATIVDLAVRGYLSITELPKAEGIAGLFEGQDWTLTRRRSDAADLKPYERIVFEGLFERGEEVRLSELKEHFYTSLAKAQEELYADATERKWFSGNPEQARILWAVTGSVVIAAGFGLTFLLGSSLGAGLVGVPLILAGGLLLLLSRSMARRTAMGSELLHRSLGFREYMVTAETDRQRLFEQVNIFAEYLPYAIIFGCVERWARAFEGIDTTPATSSWYHGMYPANAMLFSQGLANLNSQVSSVIASTPASTGGSGFSGGFSGGGIGGGGGGSW